MRVPIRIEVNAACRPCPKCGELPRRPEAFHDTERSVMIISAWCGCGHQEQELPMPRPGASGILLPLDGRRP